MHSKPTNEAKAIWRLAKIVEFDGEFYKPAPEERGSSGVCQGCHFHRPGARCMDFTVRMFYVIDEAPHSCAALGPWKKVEKPVA